MGMVYKAFDPYMQRNVAIKVADPRSLSDDRIRRRLVELFFTEARYTGCWTTETSFPYDAGQDGTCTIWS
jgi:hypothetical protein